MRRLLCYFRGNKTNVYSREDFIAAICLFLCFVAFAVFSLPKSFPWGDDCYAYISEGISIAEGTFEEQTALNTYLHPSRLPDEAVGKSLVYVWGYPLLLSFVYRVFGYDTVTFSSLVYYYIPSIIAYGLIASIWFLLMRKRCSVLASLLVVCSICSSSIMVAQFRQLYSDMVFLALVLTSFFLAEQYVSSCTRFDRSFKRDMPRQLLLGFMLFYTYETRLNGIVVVLMVSVLLATLYKNGKKAVNLRLHFAPLLFCLLFIILSENLLFAPATSNTSDFARTSFRSLLNNAHEFFDYFAALKNSLFYINTTRLSHFLFFALFIFGMFNISAVELVYLVFAVVSIVGTILLPYSQGIRYYLPVIPFIFMFIAKGADRIFVVLASDKNIRTPLICLATFFVLLNAGAHFYNVISTAIAENNAEHFYENELEGNYYLSSPFSTRAIEAYIYIYNSIPDDAVILFFKPRLLYLNTAHKSFSLNGAHDLSEADYYLVNNFYDHIVNLPFEHFSEDQLRPVFDNKEYTLYEIVSPQD